MCAVNRGKDFEAVVKKSFEKVSNCSIDRLPDQVAGFKGVNNICDFLVYKRPFQLYLECKTTNSNTLNFSNISKNQWDGLTKKSKIDGVIAGVMIWFVNLDKTIFIPISILNVLRDLGYKSINGKKLEVLEDFYINVPGKKKQVFFDYDMSKFLERLYYFSTTIID